MDSRRRRDVTRRGDAKAHRYNAFHEAIPEVLCSFLLIVGVIRFGVADEKGTLDPGKLADFVILGSDPGKEAKAFANVPVTVRSGRVIWQTAGEQHR